jgi:hypothetical protein
MTETIESLAALLRRYQADGDDAPPEVQRASLGEALRGGEDPLHIVTYMRQLGIAVSELDDLLKIAAATSSASWGCGVRVGLGVGRGRVSRRGLPRRSSRSNSIRASIGEAAGARMAMPPLQEASDGGYAPSQMAGSAGHTGNVGWRE